MKILALEHELPNATAEGFQEYAKDEAHQVWALVQAGVIREANFRVNRSEAVLVLECQTVEEAQDLERAILAADLEYAAGDAAVRHYRIPYGEPVDSEYGEPRRDYLSGELRYATPLPATDDVPAAPDRKPAAAADVPLCGPGQLEWTARQMPAPSMGFTGMSLFLSNVGTHPCSVISSRFRLSCPLPLRPLISLAIVPSPSENT